MLKGIPSALSPQLLKVLAEMGHGDTIVIGDANFAAAAHARKAGGEVIYASGVTSTELLDAILQLFPLDFVQYPVRIMDKPAEHAELPTPVWDEYKAIVSKYDKRGASCCGMIPKQQFYDEAAKAYAVISSGERAFYGCVILQKGAI